MIQIDSVPYSQIKFIFVTSHWDIHLKGLCKHNGKLRAFTTVVGDYDEEADEWEESICDIFKLSLWEKIQLLYRKKKFELMVGYHYSYENGIRKKRYFYYRKPQWLYKQLFKLYYKKKKN